MPEVHLKLEECDYCDIPNTTKEMVWTEEMILICPDCLDTLDGIQKYHAEFNVLYELPTKNLK